VPARAFLVIALLVGIVIGLAAEPDSGTQASLGAPDIHGLVLGANHGKPLPTVTTVADLLGLLGLGTATLLTLALVAAADRLPSPLVSHDDGARHRSVFRSPTRARRGPPQGS
jgi:hypothetical protein